MSTTLTIRNLDESVKQKLRMMGAAQGRSMEAQAREVLTQVMQRQDAQTANAPKATPAAGAVAAKNRGKFDSLIGIWKGGPSTDALMQITRGE